MIVSLFNYTYVLIKNSTNLFDNPIDIFYLEQNQPNLSTNSLFLLLPFPFLENVSPPVSYKFNCFFFIILVVVILQLVNIAQIKTSVKTVLIFDAYRIKGILMNTLGNIIIVGQNVNSKLKVFLRHT